MKRFLNRLVLAVVWSLLAAAVWAADPAPPASALPTAVIGFAEKFGALVGALMFLTRLIVRFTPADEDNKWWELINGIIGLIGLHSTDADRGLKPTDNGGNFPRGAGLLILCLLPLCALAPLRESSAQGTADPVVTAVPVPDTSASIQDGFQRIVDAVWSGTHEWYLATYGLYATALDNKWGGGVGAFYPLSNLIVAGVRIDYVDGGFWMPSGNCTLQLPLHPIPAWPGLTVTPFGYAGIGVPISGAKIGDFTIPGTVKNNNGEATAILGYGAALSIFRSADKAWTLSVIGDVETWSRFPGKQYRFGLVIKHPF